MGELIFVAAISALVSGTVTAIFFAKRTHKMGFEWARAEVKLARAEDKRGEVENRLSDYHNLVCPGDNAKQVLHDVGEIMKSDNPQNWVQGPLLTETDEELCQRYDFVVEQMEERGLATG